MKDPSCSFRTLPFKPYREKHSHFIVDQGHPQMEMIFQAHQSGLKKMGSRLWNIQERGDEEKILRDRGYGAAYIRGISEGREWMEVVKRLRQLKPHPSKTHIEYLADSN